MSWLPQEIYDGIIDELAQKSTKSELLSLRLVSRQWISRTNHHAFWKLSMSLDEQTFSFLRESRDETEYKGIVPWSHSLRHLLGILPLSFDLSNILALLLDCAPHLEDVMLVHSQPPESELASWMMPHLLGRYWLRFRPITSTDQSDALNLGSHRDPWARLSHYSLTFDLRSTVGILYNENMLFPDNLALLPCLEYLRMVDFGKGQSRLLKRLLEASEGSLRSLHLGFHKVELHRSSLDGLSLSDHTYLEEVSIGGWTPIDAIDLHSIALLLSTLPRTGDIKVSILRFLDIQQAPTSPRLDSVLASNSAVRKVEIFSETPSRDEMFSLMSWKLSLLAAKGILTDLNERDHTYYVDSDSQTYFEKFYSDADPHKNISHFPLPRI